jgi:poly(hydroxyalkanoate) granule-associated protein
MVKKPSQSATEQKNGNQFSNTVRESAQQIWLAGLGAFAKAQEEGSRMFEALVKEGTSIQRKTQAAAEEKLSETASRMATMASDISSKAAGQWDKLESIFEQRVSKALNKLNVPSAKDVDALAARVDELSRQVAELSTKISTAKRRAAGTAAKPGAKRTSTRKST